MERNRGKKSKLEMRSRTYAMLIKSKLFEIRDAVLICPVALLIMMSEAGAHCRGLLLSSVAIALI